MCNALCVIFIILVSFLWGNALFASKAKINVFGKNFEWSVWGQQRSEEIFSKNIDFILLGNRATTQNTFLDIFMRDQNHENHT